MRIARSVETLFFTSGMLLVVAAVPLGAGSPSTHRPPTSLAEQATGLVPRAAGERVAETLTQAELVALGEELFFTETFEGNGRTCGSCHLPEDDFGLRPATIAALPGSDPLFIAEADPNLAALEHPPLMRSSRGLILENIDGFESAPVFRNSPHLLNLSLTAPYGLSGEFADLRTFTTGAVLQHFPKTMGRAVDVDFRLPTADELIAMEAFMQSISARSDQDFALENVVTTVAQRRGSDLFFSTAKCFNCHNGPVLSDSVAALGGGNRNFNTGVVALPINQTADPDNPGGGTFPKEAGNLREFNTPPLFGAADTAPFFHDSSVATLREAVEFYDGLEFNDSPGGDLVGGIQLLPSQIDDLVTFLEALDDFTFQVTPGALFFGARETGAGPTAAQTVTIANLAVDPLTVDQVTLEGGSADQFAFEVTDPTTLAVTFDPSSIGLKRTTLEVHTDAGSIGVRLVGVGSGPAGQPTFTDVSAVDTFFPFVESIFRAGITAGCTSAPAYCKNDPVTRAQVAVLLARAMGEGEVPPRGIFADVSPTGFGAGSIERLAAAGVTNGCGGGAYCPNDFVTRAQMAVLLVRATGRTPIDPPTGTAFADVPASSFGAGAIERLQADGVTNGCGGGNFCPNDLVTRGQMAAFLVRAFNLPL